MPFLRQPIPMLAPNGWGASNNPKIPANGHVKAKLESLDSTCRALECYEAASMFILHKIASVEGATQHQHRTCAVSLEQILNWTFIVAQKPIFDWNEVDLQRYLDFVQTPDCSWVGAACFSRFITDKNMSYEQGVINERWRPFRRKLVGGVPKPPHWAILDKERRVVLGFFSFLSLRTSYPLAHLNANFIEKLRLTIPTKRPPRSIRRKSSELLFKMTMFELDWVFKEAAELSESNRQYELVLFAMAIMRYSNVPLKSLCRSLGIAGVLSQFYHQNSQWHIIVNTGSPTERTYKLDAQMDSYIHRYFSYLGVTWDQPLPETHIFRRPDREQGIGYDHLSGIMENFRKELCQLFKKYRSSAPSIRWEVTRKISFRLIRRSRPVPRKESKKRGRPPHS